MRTRTAISLIATLLPLTLATAQTGRIHSTESGLSSSLVNCIIQDSRGYVWMATEYGLNRFDGYRVSTYHHDASDSTSLKNDYVRALFEADGRHLLVGCIDGLMRYDIENDCFHEIPMTRAGRQVHPHITQMKRLRNGEVWVSTSGQGMFRMEEGLSEAASLDGTLGAANYNFLSCFFEDAGGTVWIGTYGRGIIAWDANGGRTESFTLEAADDDVNAIAEDNSGRLFIGTQKQGLLRHDRQAGGFVPVSCADDKVTAVYSLLSSGRGLLVGTDGQGIKLYNPDKDRLEEYTDRMTPYDYSSDKVHAMATDREGNLWAGLFQKGVIMIPQTEDKFEYYGRNSVFSNPIGDGCVMSVLEDGSGDIYVGTDNEGLFKLNEEGVRLRHFTPDGSPHCVPSTVMCMYEDSQGGFWIGSYSDGLAKMDRATGSCEYIPGMKNDKILSLTEDRYKNLYIATLGSGFYRYNIADGTLTHFESSKDESGDLSRDELANDWINCLHCDGDGLIWIAHYKGISCFDPVTGSFLSKGGENTVITDCIGNVITEGRDGTLWFGTSEGLFKLSKGSVEITKFTVGDGLPSSVICGICLDGNGDAWLSTYLGLCRLSVSSGQFTAYSAKDGLQGNEFTRGAFCKSPSGKMYFGGTSGITAFMPSDIAEAQEEMHVTITGVSLFGTPVRKNTLSGGKPVIGCAVQDAEAFRFAHTDNTLDISLSTFLYRHSGQVAYEYKIAELDSRWLSTEPGENRLTYNNLPPGKYTLSVRASLRGRHSDTHSVTIIVSPPWYRTWWATCIYLTLLCLLAYGVANYVRARLRYRKEIAERRHAEEISEAKLRFFTNISHEIRTPMTLVINPLEKLMAENGDARLGSVYQTIHRNAQRILRLINQLLDIRKIDNGQMAMKFRETEMVGFIEDVMTTFRYPADKRGIAFTFAHGMPELKAWVDRNNFDKVLMNILSNAFKYTPDGGEITVSLTTGADASRDDALREWFEVCVTDSGPGINKSDMDRIFDRFYQADNKENDANVGTGIGLHLSRSIVQLHHGDIFAANREDASGSRFTVRIPLGSGHLRPSEMDEAEESETRTGMHRAEAAPPETQAVSSATTQVRRGRKGSHSTVLVVDDEEEILTYLGDELSTTYNVITCTDGKQAWEAVLRDMPDLVISDVMLPGMDGLSLCHKIKGNTNVNHIPVILLTAKTTLSDRLEGIGSGADAYMSKPFNMGLLKGTAANLLTNRKLLHGKFTGEQLQEDKIEKIELKSGNDMLMERIMKAVNAHMSDNKFSVEALAGEVGLSRVHIHRKLREMTGLTARDFIMNIRMRQAADLLSQESKPSISEVAWSVGFTNLSHFSQSFKEHFGVSPTEYAASKPSGEASPTPGHDGAQPPSESE